MTKMMIPKQVCTPKAIIFTLLILFCTAATTRGQTTAFEKCQADASENNNLICPSCTALNEVVTSVCYLNCLIYCLPEDDMCMSYTQISRFTDSATLRSSIFILTKQSTGESLGSWTSEHAGANQPIDEPNKAHVETGQNGYQQCQSVDSNPGCSGYSYDCSNLSGGRVWDTCGPNESDPDADPILNAIAKFMGESKTPMAEPGPDFVCVESIPNTSSTVSQLSSTVALVAATAMMYTLA